MTRRERHLRIIDWMDERNRRLELDILLQRRGMTVFTDEAVEELASMLVKSHRRMQAMNKRNREIAANRTKTAVA